MSAFNQRLSPLKFENQELLADARPHLGFAAEAEDAIAMRFRTENRTA